MAGPLQLLTFHFPLQGTFSLSSVPVLYGDIRGEGSLSTFSLKPMPFQPFEITLDVTDGKIKTKRGEEKPVRRQTARQ